MLRDVSFEQHGPVLVVQRRPHDLVVRDSLVSADVAPVCAGGAQALARHAKIETTMGVYTDLTSVGLRGAVERLAPNVGTSRRAVAGQ